jgi:hypothetical protein
VTLGELREHFGVPQIDVANRLGMSEAALAGLEAVSVSDASGNTLSLFLLGLGGRLLAAVPTPHGAERTVRL